MRTPFENINRVRAAKEVQAAIQNFQDNNDPVTLRFHLKNAFSALVSKKGFDKVSKSEAYHVYSNLVELIAAFEQVRKPLKKVRSTGDEFFH